MRTSQTVGRFVTSYDWDPSTGSGQAVASGLPLLLQETKREVHCEKPPDPCEDVLRDVVTESTYVYGLDLISATDASGEQLYYFTDGLGSTRCLWMTC